MPWLRHSGESRNPVTTGFDAFTTFATSAAYWMPACVGMTRKSARRSNSPGAPARHEGMARRKTQSHFGSCLAARGRRSARHMRSCACSFAATYRRAGPAFRRECPACDPFSRLGSNSPRPSAVERLSIAGVLTWTSRSSASSWQGLVVDPGGAPPPPECLAANQARGAPHPVPPQLTPRDGAPQWTRCAEFMGGRGSGDKAGS